MPALHESYHHNDEFTDLINVIKSDPLDKKNILTLLNARGDLQQLLFHHAREVRKKIGMDFCMLRGVIEISNYCQKNCSYCAMRACNTEVIRYRMQEQEILDVAESVFKSGITTVFLQGGQDPQMDEILEKVIPEIKRRFDGNILLCVGERKSELYRKWRSLGADSYIMKFESSSPEVYFEATNSDLSRRLECINDIKQAGFKIGVGNIIGLPGQTLESIAEDILLALRIDPDFISSAPFIPNQGTPFIQFQTGDLDLTLNWMAICRILFENCLIPSVSALEKIRKGGQVMGLNAGANVVTINFTPQHYREKYTIYNKQRFVVSLDHALETANLAGLRPILK